MDTGAILYWVLYFIVSLIIAWIVLSVVIAWFQPAFYNTDGTVNWWTTLWIAALIIIFTWLLVLLLGWIISLFTGSGCNTCVNKCNKCQNVCGATMPSYGIF